jgi:hypothetical protein
MRLTPNHDRKTTSNEQRRQTEPNRDDESGNNDFPTGNETKQMYDRDYGEECHRDRSEWLQDRPPRAPC